MDCAFAAREVMRKGAKTMSEQFSTGANSGVNATTSLPVGARGITLYCEPDDTSSVITNAITAATSSVWIEMYQWSDPRVMQALVQRKNQANTAKQPFDVQIMLYQNAPSDTINPSHFTAPDGSDFTLSSSQDIITQLQRLNVGIQARFCNAVVETEKHAKFMVIDGKTAYVMTANFTEAALGGSSYSNWTAPASG
jgi:cardiolipin synthase A/B